ncbi:hypothetical protein Tdes44962_MAKER07003 [Teratosphaeria destructans]|uniref:Uncharacterized protein n=1 Tax=Teratosphaeria destructans TaxID=418781 RepID=A0A9W7W6X3_9PEZI|nr:hypothetical protein Tdes44962_MAKER07003 [Teratosphaeria destructans]
MPEEHKGSRPAAITMANGYTKQLDLGGPSLAAADANRPLPVAQSITPLDAIGPTASLELAGVAGQLFCGPA